MGHEAIEWTAGNMRYILTNRGRLWEEPLHVGPTSHQGRELTGQAALREVYAELAAFIEPREEPEP